MSLLFSFLVWGPGAGDSGWVGICTRDHPLPQTPPLPTLGTDFSPGWALTRVHRAEPTEILGLAGAGARRNPERAS